MKTNLLSLFSGIEGFCLGLQQGGFEINKHYYSEIDKYANAVTRYNYPDGIGLGTVANVSGKRITDRINIITFGSPCQDLSLAGKRKGLAGSRSRLFFEAIRIIRELQPDLFIWENVKGAFSSNRGEDYIAILREFADIGLYECEWQLLNTRWVLPQNRERIYFVGHLRGAGFGKVFPIRESSEIFGQERKGFNHRIQSKHIASCLDARYGALRGNGETYLKKVSILSKDSQGQRVYDSQGISCQLTAQGGGWGAKTGLYCVAHGPTRVQRSNLTVHNMQPRSPTRPSIKNKTSKGGSGHLTKQDGTAYCLDAANSNAVEYSSQIRRLTPIECMRLQGFPDNWCDKGIGEDGREIIISDTQKYKMAGNAVSVPIVAMIARRLLEGKIQGRNE